MIIEVHLDGLESQIARFDLNGQYLARCAPGFALIARSDVPAAGQSADLTAFAQKLSGLSQNELATLVHLVRDFGHRLVDAHDQYQQTQLECVKEALRLL